METLHCYFDGACEPVNPCGNMGIGAIVLHGERVLFEHSLYVPASKNNSNNVAEYRGLLTLLIWLKENRLNDKRIIVSGDSNLVIQQMNGAWKMKKGLYLQYAREARDMLNDFPNITLQWIPREKNYIADELSKRSMLQNKCEFKIQKQ